MAKHCPELDDVLPRGKQARLDSMEPEGRAKRRLDLHAVSG